ncbi:hypothetical protein ACTL6P_22540 [Endozoicomonas acroporae]|uniref:hypothetical protein n=1 Tax=Endozoicomonas acroporae TaxID=1701104 RepID=UPI000C78A3CD|nr:hypothetical protein [Endozoicomonas acroporae]
MNITQHFLIPNTDNCHYLQDTTYQELQTFIDKHVQAVDSVKIISPDDPRKIKPVLPIMARQAQHTLCNQLLCQDGLVQDNPYLKFRSFPNRLYTFDESIQGSFEKNKGQSHPRKPCALCNNDSRLLKIHTEGITIISNFRPYSSECWLIKPTEHLDQSHIFVKSSELFDLATAMGSAYTFAHSGYRGNSQPHLHIHAMKENLPLRKALDNGQLSLEADLPVIQHGKTTIRWMTGDQAHNTAHFSGIHIAGENPAEFAQIFNNTLKYLSKSDVCGTGGYNLVYWLDDNNSLHSFIFPRNQNANVNPQYVPEKQSYGCLEMSGLLIMAPVNDKKVGEPAAVELASMRDKPYGDFVARARNELTRLTPEQWQELAMRLEQY